MKARASTTIALVLVWVLLALPATALATPPEPLTIEAQLWLNGPASAAGTFATNGLFADSGNCSEVFFVDTDEGTIHGVKTLESAAGSITIRFQAELTWTGLTTGMAVGRWVVVSGTGAYKKLHGAGETYAELDLAAYPNPNIVATYTGQAHFD